MYGVPFLRYEAFPNLNVWLPE